MPEYPLSRWADAQLLGLGGLNAATLMCERALLNGFRVPGEVSSGGGCRFYQTADASIALNLSRETDWELLPALLGVEDYGDLETGLLTHQAAELVARGRALGLAVAALDERPANPACTSMTTSLPCRPNNSPPLVIDFSSLWAGPLASHLLWQAGAQVVKVETRNRPDAMRDGDPALFARINQGKDNIAVSWPEDRAAITALIMRADIVIEASRPRALLQLAIDADALVREVPGLVWITITGHGMGGEAANWIGFGDDCGVAGGLSGALFEATGQLGFVGDAIADPLTGIYAARKVLEQRHSGQGARLSVSMSGVVAEALAADRESIVPWAALCGELFPPIPMREAGPVAPLGADNAKWLPC